MASQQHKARTLSTAPKHTLEDKVSRITKPDAIRRAFSEFLRVPTLIIVAFFLLAIGAYILDRGVSTDIAWLEQLRQIISTYLFNSAQTASSLLSMIAGSIITVTSITFSLLLIAVQQASSTLTFQVIDQFLRRKMNQVYVGFFIGLGIYSLVILALISPPFIPLFGAALAVPLAIAALYILVVLIYNTMDQMRPTKIIGAIHDYTIKAREHQRPLLHQTRQTARYAGASSVLLKATERGYVTEIKLDKLERAVQQTQGEVEIVLCVSIGSYVAFGDVLAEIKAQTIEEAAAVGQAMQGAVQLERVRDQQQDAAYGISQITTIAWTSVSTSKQNPAPGVQAAHALRDLLARWSIAEVEERSTDTPLPVVYHDNVLDQLMDAFEALVVVASESMQYQVFAQVMQAFAIMFDRVPQHMQDRMEAVIRRSLSALGDHVLTTELDAALSAVSQTLCTAGRSETADAVQSAHEQMASTVGKLNARSTRAQSAKQSAKQSPQQSE